MQHRWIAFWEKFGESPWTEEKHHQEYGLNFSPPFLAKVGVVGSNIGFSSSIPLDAHWFYVSDGFTMHEAIYDTACSPSFSWSSEPSDDVPTGDLLLIYIKSASFSLVGRILIC